MLKKLLRNSANKRRKIKDYARKGKDGKMIKCKFKKTATIGSTTTLSLKLDAFAKVNDRLTKLKRKGKVLAKANAEGKQTKRERVVIGPLLNK